MLVTPSVDVVEYDDGGEKEEDEQLEGRRLVLDLNQPSSQEKASERWWEESEVKSLTEFEEDGLAYEDWDYSEGEMEGGDSKVSEQMIHVTQKEGEVPHQQVQTPDFKEEVQQTHRGEGGERMLSSEKNDSSLEEEQEMTWYFTWR